MATAETRRNLADRNRTLREDHTRLKTRKEEISEHLVTLLRRAKQMDKLKTTLKMDLDKAEAEARIHQNKKLAYVTYLGQDLRRLQEEQEVELLKLKNVEAEYQVCLEDYDNVLKLTTAEIESAKAIEAQIVQQQEQNASMKAVIFDYERLKRVLQEERKYFKELSNTEARSHQERVKELNKIFNKLNKEETDTRGNYQLSKFRIGLARLNLLFKARYKQYAEVFLRSQISQAYKTALGIKTFRNCLELGSLKHQISTRKLFYRWHHIVFPKNTLSNLVENATFIDIQTRRKISVLNKMTEAVNSRNMSLFHIYQKSKFLSVLANKIVRKDLHYGFCKWRTNYNKKTKIYNKLGKLLFKTVPLYQKRTAFGKWMSNAAFQSRLILANNLLQNYMSTKELSRMFRKWRFQLPDQDIGRISEYLRNLRMRGQILSRVNYQKRKSKALTTLAFRMTKIKLRNYFTKYWANVKSMEVQSLREEVLNNRAHYSELRKLDKATQNQVNAKNKRYSLLTFRAFMMSAKLRPVMRKWRNTMLLLRKRSEAMLHLAMRKENKNKITVMNQLRKCVQHFQKKQMHQVLTDLNNKMEAINEKSTNFREQLRKCIQQLGVMASKKIDNTFSYSIMCQQRVYFNKDLRLKVRHLYREYILHRFGSILASFHTKKSLDKILAHGKHCRKESLLANAEKSFLKNKIKRDNERAFYAWRGVIRRNKGCFRKMTQSENIIMFYRMASAFVAVERKSHFQEIKAKKKIIASTQIVLQTKKENLDNLQIQKNKLEESLKKIFTNFLKYEDRHMRKQYRELDERLTKRYFSRYRQNVKDQIYGQRILTHFSGFITQKNNFIFWKGINALKYENMIDLVKEELGKLNRKKKAQAEKNSKVVSDYDKRLLESEKEHAGHKAYYQYYLKKFQDTLAYYALRHEHSQNLFYAREVFNVWKRESLGSKGLALGANKVLQRNLVYPAFQEVVRIFKKMKSHAKSQDLCVDILLRKAKHCMKDCMVLWRCNLKKLQCHKMEAEANYMIQHREDITEECKSKANLISIESLRLRKRKMLITCFMAMKTDWTEKTYLETYKVGKMQDKIGQRLIRSTIQGLKWLMFYKKTKRGYLKFKQIKFQKELKSDVFNCLKIHRQEHYRLMKKATAIYDTIHFQYLRFAMDKIINVGAYERDELDYERKRKLRTLVMNKVSRVQIIKRKIMAKWKAWLIPRFHYLPNIMKTAELGVLKRAFAKIHQHQYWNPIYIKSAADKITNEGYNQVNATTNNLVKQGYDPDEIKEFLERRNEKDQTTIKAVVSRVKTWGNKDDLVRAWNSWKQYMLLKQKIRKSLAKVFNIAQGIGRYWNRWKSKDPEFNAILEKQSRGNMLERYRDLGRLLKEYKRDVKDSKIYCGQLKEINDEYAEKNDEGVRMALSILSSNLKVGLKQGLQIWRTRVKEQHRVQFDERYDQLSHGISMMVEQRNKMRYRLSALKEENFQLKEKCNLGAECGEILQRLLQERDVLSINLADKEHNLKLLLEDNLRLKQKIRTAKANAEKLIHRVQQIEP